MLTWKQWLDLPKNSPKTPSEYFAAIIILIFCGKKAGSHD
jgi:hypothetical protein